MYTENHIGADRHYNQTSRLMLFLLKKTESFSIAVVYLKLSHTTNRKAGFLKRKTLLSHLVNHFVTFFCIRGVTVSTIVIRGYTEMTFFMFTLVSSSFTKVGACLLWQQAPMLLKTTNRKKFHSESQRYCIFL